MTLVRLPAWKADIFAGACTRGCAAKRGSPRAMDGRPLRGPWSCGSPRIIAVDYWSPELDDAKVRARDLALKAAREKADSLLKTLYTALPAVINVQEQTKVRYPESLYDRFENSYAEEVTPAFKSEMPFIRAYRPRNTYYRGLQSDGDIQPAGLPMRPEISVVSTVRLYFQSPAALQAKPKSPVESGAATSLRN